MSGLSAIAALRRRGWKPRFAMVFLVAEAQRERFPIGHRGGVSIDIPRSASLADIDFRPLVGLSVQVHDTTGDAARQRAVCKAIAEVEPSLLVAFTERDDGTVTMHRRFAGNPPRQESTRL